MTRVTIHYDVSEDEQVGGFMNATLQGNPTTVFSIAVTAPDEVLELTDQYVIGFVLTEALQPLVDKGYDIEIQIGAAS